MAQITPPVEFNLFVLQGMTRKAAHYIGKHAFPLFLLMVVMVRYGISFGNHQLVTATDGKADHGHRKKRGGKRKRCAYCPWAILWTVEFGNRIDPALHGRVLGLLDALEHSRADAAFRRHRRYRADLSVR